MPNAWIDSVKQTHELSYYLNSVTAPWRIAVQAAAREFNNLSRRHRLGVKYVESRTASTDTGGANITVATANGAVTFNYLGRHVTSMNGMALHGRTLLISQANSPIEKAFMVLPSQPLINTPSGQRPVGAGLMKVIAFHELIHGCGLHNSDHSPDDVFNGNPSADAGSIPARDRIQIMVGGQYRFIPPILLSATTVRKISPLWR